MQARLEWVDIGRVLPNPMNPRKDHSIKFKEMQEIIESKGWEEGITCYKNRDYYVILSGHRRWHAARKMGAKEIPLFIVSAPKDEAEELDRLGSVQGGQVDWNPYEWAKYTYDMWKNLNEISYAELAEKMGVTNGLITARIRVYHYYPKVEIEDKLENGMYSITMLYYILSWINKLTKYHPDVVESMGEDFIRKQMLKKYENKCFNSQITHDKTLVQGDSSGDIINFLADINKKLSECQMEISLRKQPKNKDIIQNSMEINSAISDVRRIQCRTKKEAEKLIDELQKLLNETNEKEVYINNFLKKTR